MTEEFNYNVRRANADDLQAIADAHQASIVEIGPAYYNEDVIKIWGRKRALDGYREAVDKHGEIFFIAEAKNNPGYVLGFSGYRYEDNLHRLQGLYVRGNAARRGIGQKLTNAVEQLALENGAKELHVEASLSGEDFYRAYGFQEYNRYTRMMGDVNPVEVNVLSMLKIL